MKIKLILLVGLWLICNACYGQTSSINANFFVNRDFKNFIGIGYSKLKSNGSEFQASMGLSTFIKNSSKLDTANSTGFAKGFNNNVGNSFIEFPTFTAGITFYLKRKGNLQFGPEIMYMFMHRREELAERHYYMSFGRATYYEYVINKKISQHDLSIQISFRYNVNINSRLNLFVCSSPGVVFRNLRTNENTDILEDNTRKGSYSEKQIDYNFSGGFIVPFKLGLSHAL